MFGLFRRKTLKDGLSSPEDLIAFVTSLSQDDRVALQVAAAYWWKAKNEQPPAAYGRAVTVLRLAKGDDNVMKAFARDELQMIAKWVEQHGPQEALRWGKECVDLALG